MSDDRMMISIESMRGVGEMASSPSCLVTWGPRQRPIAVADVRQVAEDLCACAAYADMIGELLRLEMPPDMISKFVTGMLADRRKRYFGHPQAFYMMPAGSSGRRVGVVALAQRARFHRGEADSYLNPDEAREMARIWLESAEASEADTLFGAVLERSGWMAPTELDALFGLLAEIRSGKADLPPLS